MNLKSVKKFNFIQSTTDGQSCHQKIKLNGNTIYEEIVNCPDPIDGQVGIFVTGDDYRVLDGQLRNFKFFTSQENSKK